MTREGGASRSSGTRSSRTAKAERYKGTTGWWSASTGCAFRATRRSTWCCTSTSRGDGTKSTGCATRTSCCRPTSAIPSLRRSQRFQCTTTSARTWGRGGRNGARRFETFLRAGAGRRIPGQTGDLPRSFARASSAQPLSAASVPRRPQGRGTRSSSRWASTVRGRSTICPTQSEMACCSRRRSRLWGGTSRCLSTRRGRRRGRS
mmetsp:Transcript_34329/g.83518  ORF Transcript_34329/g.83518 Transcript_34329/m.83518 type:complete len:205 (+) Transcript_34329:179-793(+)